MTRTGPNPDELDKVLTLFALPALLLTLEGAVGNVVEPQDGLVGVLDDQIFSVLKTQVEDKPRETSKFTFWAMMRSRMHLTTPQALSMFRLICWPNSTGLNFCVPRMTCLELSLTLYRVTYPNLRLSAPARILWTVHLASLQALFFSSLASTAPLWVSSFCLQSTCRQC